MVAKHVFYEGKVQGVGFRYTTRRIATGFEVAGWVRNLRDGRVEMQVAGEGGEVDEFLQEIRDSVLGGNIRGEEVYGMAPPDVPFKGFSIR